MINWTLQKRKIADLMPSVKNPRQLSKDQATHLKISIEKFGLIDKPIINTDNHVIAGHQRLKLLKKMAVKEVECYVPDRTLTQNECDELLIRHNKNTGSWDFDALANMWDLHSLIDWGFNEKDFDIDIIDVNASDQKDECESHKCESCGQKIKSKKVKS